MKALTPYDRELSPGAVQADLNQFETLALQAQAHSQKILRLMTPSYTIQDNGSPQVKANISNESSLLHLASPKATRRGMGRGWNFVLRAQSKCRSQARRGCWLMIVQIGMP
jgi:hypothetical protein